MGAISDIEEVRRHRRRTKARKKMIVYAVIIASIALVFTFKQYFTLQHMGIVIKDFSSSFSNGKFPLNLDEGVPKAICTSGGYTAMATSTTFVNYNGNGAMVRNVPHSMQNPSIKAQGRYNLLFDRGNKSFGLFSKTSEIYSLTGEQKILDGDVNASGYVAMATTSERYLSQISVYDTLNQEIFAWYTSTDYVTSLDFSGKYIAVATSRVENSELVGCVYLLSTKKSKEMFCISYKNELPLKVSLNGSSISVYTDKGYYLYDRAGTLRGSYPFEGATLLGTDSENTSKVCFSVGSGTALNRVLVLDKNGKLRGEIDPQDSVLGVHYYGGKIAVLLSDGLVVYDKNGAVLTKHEYSKTCLRLFGDGKTVYIQASDSMIKEKL